MSPHDGIREDLPAYLAHELTGKRALEVRKHLAGCAPCRREAEDVRQLGALVRSAPLEHQPPPHLERQVMALVELDRAAGEAVRLPDEKAPRRRPWTRRGLLPAGIAAGFAAVALVLTATAIEWRERAIEAEDRNQAWADVYGSCGDFVNEVRLTGSGIRPGEVRATFIHHGGDNFGISMRSDGLGPPPPGSRYEVWLSDEAGWTSTGSFEISESSGRVFYFHLGEDPRSYDKIWVTVEPADGDPAPSGRAVAEADLGA